MATFPCSICEASFASPKDLGTHILQKHCEATNEQQKQETKEEPIDVEEEKTLVMDVDPLDHPGSGDTSNSDIPATQCLDDTILPVLPRSPSMEEQKQKFMMYHLATDPSNFMRYVCLLCSKLYTSRYNIRMHLNSHTGRNVHTCPYCSIQFTSRQTYEGHLKSHTNTKESSIIKEDLDNSIVDHNAGPQIVSVKSIENFEDSLSKTEEIQIEPDIVNSSDDDDLEDVEEIEDDIKFDSKRNNIFIKAGSHTLPAVAPAPPPAKISSLQIRPLSQMKPAAVASVTSTEAASVSVTATPSPATAVAPTQTYTCSFCNGKQSSQDNLFQHLSQHVNFGGVTPSKSDLTNGYMSFKVPSPINPGQMRLKYMCMSCGKCFGKEQPVKIHLNVHYGDNIYNCRFCEKVFANYSAFEEHVKTHSEEYKFSCKFCNATFINRNVMVTHQRTCTFSTDETSNGSSPNSTSTSGFQNSGNGSLQITPVFVSNTSPTSSGPPPQKRVKLVLSGLKLKSFIASKDAEMNNGISSNALPTQPLPMTVLPDFAAITGSGNNNNKFVVSSTAAPYQLASVSGNGTGNNDSSADESVGSSNSSSVVKTVVRKRAPVFPFEPEDHYVPDNNSNNIISKHDIHPPPTSAERRQGYCLRPFRDTGQQRYICCVCGKHYTTMYNMRQHRNIHTGSGLHSCRYCGRSFTHKHVWETHERIHTGERPFRCPTCPKDFADRSNYNSHRKLCAMGRKVK